MLEPNQVVYADDAVTHLTGSLRPSPDAVTLLEEDRSGSAISNLEPLPAQPSLSVSPIHSSEITTRSFPTVFRGLDPEAVREWLQIIGSSQEALEDEVERLSHGWDALLLAAARLRASLAEPDQELAARWSALARCLSDTRPNSELAATTSGHARAALDEAARGRRRAPGALFDAATQLARLQHEIAVLRHENEMLRSRLIEVVAVAS